MNKIICNNCGRDINALGQDNMSWSENPLCEDCYNKIKNANDFSKCCCEDFLEYDCECCPFYDNDKFEIICDECETDEPFEKVIDELILKKKEEIMVLKEAKVWVKNCK